VNNAGVCPQNNIFNMDEDIYNTVMNINYKAPLFLCKAITDVFIEKKIKGSIVNIGSVNAHCGQDELLVYSCSKGALMTMSKNLGNALGGYGIRVNQINIGWTYTQREHNMRLGNGNPPDWYKNIPSSLAPRGSILTPREIAKHVAFWASDISAPATGSVYELEQYPIERIQLI